MKSSTEEELNIKNLALTMIISTLIYSLVTLLKFAKGFSMSAVFVTVLLLISCFFVGKTKYKGVVWMFIAPIIAINLTMSFVDALSSSHVEKHIKSKHSTSIISIKETWHAGGERIYKASYISPNSPDAEVATELCWDGYLSLSVDIICSKCDPSFFDLKIEIGSLE